MRASRRSGRPSLRAAALAASLLCLGLLGHGDVRSQEDGDRPANRLIGETSPYLLQHAHNPVDWYPWGPEAFERARAEEKPVFLSVGYSSCYWCHVMERECFEDEEIAALLNEHFICIKVDREERPDVDQVYMTALQGVNRGSGGWPMSMFLTPDGRPFYGGTYFPPAPRDGMPGFPQVLGAIADAWRDQRATLVEDADRLTAYVRRASGTGPVLGAVPLTRDLAARGLVALADRFDPEYGGFGYDPDQPRRPKFPEPVNLVFLLDQHRRGRGESVEPGPLAMVETTLDHVSRGGIRDHLAGGYHRYSTDRVWAVPHFEKMLYDNAQLVSLYLDAYELTSEPRWRREAEDALTFIASVMTDEAGGFHSALDAETDSEEGAYYVWTREQVADALGDGAENDLFARVYGLDRAPNFEGGRHVLLRPDPPVAQAEAAGLSTEELERRLAPMRAKLLVARRDREPPLKDDKVLTSWNALMIGAYADAFRVLGDARYRDAAVRAADFLRATLRDDGRLLRTYRAGTARLPAYLEDYAYLIDALLRLHDATSEDRWLAEARTLADRMIADFYDEESGGFFFTGDDHESLLARVKDPYDGVMPGPNAVAIRDLLALHRRVGEPRYLELAGASLRSFAPAIDRAPGAGPLMLLAVEEYLDAVDDGAAPSPFAAGALAVDEEAMASPAHSVLATKAESLKAGPVAAGSTFEVTVTLTIREGYHINANPAGLDNLVPTTLALADDATAELRSVDYPDGERKALGGQDEPIPVYEGTVELKARVRLGDTVPAGPAALDFEIRYQACDDRACLPPASAKVRLPIEVHPADN